MPAAIKIARQGTSTSTGRRITRVAVECQNALPLPDRCHGTRSRLTPPPIVPALRSEVHPGPLHVVLTGNVPINSSFNKTLEADLQRAELVALPIALLLLVLIFRSAVAALLPVGVALVTIAGGVAATVILSNFVFVSQYAFNIVTLVGLGVSIDYSLMFVSRFREELAAGVSREDAVAKAMATAGRAVAFSGIAVAIGLSSLLFFQGTFLASMGVAGAMVVGLALLYALTVLPAGLAVNPGDRDA